MIEAFETAFSILDADSTDGHTQDNAANVSARLALQLRDIAIARGLRKAQLCCTPEGFPESVVDT